MTLNVTLLYIYGKRLALLLSIRQYPAFSITIVGFGMNAFLPFRLGEVVKLTFAKKFFNISIPRLISVIMIEKFLDIFALLITSIFSSQFFFAPYFNQKFSFTVALGLIFTCSLVAIIILKFYNYKIKGWILEALSTLRLQFETNRIIRLILITTLIFLISIISIHWMFSSVFPNFSISNACMLMLIFALAVAVPGTPSGIGILEAGAVMYLIQTLNADPNQALASVLVFHVITILPQVLGTILILTTTFFRKDIKRFKVKSIKL
jgi:uncharacterized membrane protein YbhN (UPF0104 family)